MTTKHIALALVACLAVTTLAIAVKGSEADLAKDEIRTLVESAYINGAFNDLDTESMRAGFHPVFKIHGEKDGALTQYPIDE